MRRRFDYLIIPFVVYVLCVEVNDQIIDHQFIFIDQMNEDMFEQASFVDSHVDIRQADNALESNIEE